MDVERKIMVIGAAGAGKSTFLIQYLHNHFVEEYDPTIEDSYRKRVNSDGVILLLDVFDTAGYLDDEPNHTSESTAQYLQSSHFVDRLRMLIIVYDITKRSSFERVTDYWYKAKEQLENKPSNVAPVVLLLGTKLDLADQRAVKTEEGEQLARELGMMFGEISSKTRQNMDQVMQKALREITYTIDSSRARELKPTIKVTPSHQAGRMSSLLKSPIFSDAVLTLNEHKWNVHKFILSARSPVFFEIFMNPAMNEVPIKGDNISPEAVTAMIHFMYTALVDFSPKIASQVVSLSAEYKIDVLGDIAADIAKKGSYYPTSESLTARTTRLSEDLLKFSKTGFHGTHPGFDVALKVDHQKPVLTSRALLALHSKYFMDLFEKNQKSEVEIDIPDLDRAMMSRIVDWICSNHLQASTGATDVKLMKLASTFDLPKSFIETIEYNISSYVLMYNLQSHEWLAILNQNVGEQIKKLVEWQAALKLLFQSGDIWKKVNPKSRKAIKEMAAQFGTLVDDKKKKDCGIL